MDGVRAVCVVWVSVLNLCLRLRFPLDVLLGLRIRVKITLMLEFKITVHVQLLILVQLGSACGMCGLYIDLLLLDLEAMKGLRGMGSKIGWTGISGRVVAVAHILRENEKADFRSIGVMERAKGRRRLGGVRCIIRSRGRRGRGCGTVVLNGIYGKNGRFGIRECMFVVRSFSLIRLGYRDAVYC